MDDYLSKPFSLQQLEGVLGRWLKAAPPPACIDEAVLRRLAELGGDDPDGLLRKVIGAFLLDAPRRMRALGEALKQGDPRALHQAAHALKSAAANLGAHALAQTCGQLEELGRQGNLAAARELVDQLEGELGRASVALSESVHPGA
jgi:two-component system sensor histidine kinase/response regulator